jgi:FkbM family methyltransferase
MFLNAPTTNWLAVEPNESNIGYVNSWGWPCQIATCTTGLSREGGKQTLHVTNVDTGSSLLPPEIPLSMKHRVIDQQYFFPVKKREIDTLTLEQALKDVPNSIPVFVKLDTQGTELSILQGAKSLFDSRRIVGVEMESTMLAQPVMKGSGKFWQACEYMEQQGFELLIVTPIHAPRRSGRNKPRMNTYLNECDAVFTLRPDVAQNLSEDYRASLLAFYLTNFFYDEGYSLLLRDDKLAVFLRANGCNVPALIATLKAAL